MSQQPSVSVIISTCNRSRDLQETLNSLGEVCLPKLFKVELVVVDNVSSDTTSEVARSFNRLGLSVRYVFESRRGKGNAYNAGIAAARGDVLLFSDDDIRFPGNWIEGMCAPILAGEADAVAGGVRMAQHLERPWMQDMHRLCIGAATANLSNDNFELIGANMAFSRAVLAKVPCFDPELGPGALGLGEDTLFSWQLLKAGYRIKLLKEVTVEHHFNPTRLNRQAFVERSASMGRSLAYLTYHWQHKIIPLGYLRYVKACLRLKSYRVLKMPSGAPDEEGMALPEFDRLVGFQFYRQYLQERRRPRNYEKQGLVKLCNS